MLRIDIEMLALAIPWLLIVLLLVNIVLLSKKRWWWSLFVFVCIIATNRRFECVPLRLWNSTDVESQVTLRVFSFNIDGSDGDVVRKSYQLMEMVKHYSPDILFIAEYPEQNVQAMDTLMSKIFPYSTFKNQCRYHYFYSKYPLFEADRLKDEEGELTGVFTCKMECDGDTISLYGCHFASNNYDQNKKRFKPDDINNYEGIKDYLSNIGSSCDRRIEEAEILIKAISKTHHPVILMGDLNDVCGSQPLRVLETAGLDDAWWEKGIGYGATIHYPLPYRIDHIMHTEELKIKNIKVIASDGISDHEALYAEFGF